MKTNPGFILILLFNLVMIPNLQTTQGAEQNMCPIQPVKRMSWGTIRGAMSYSRKIHTIHTDFWMEGVKNSKRILKKILKKINTYEELNDNNFESNIKEQIMERFVKMNDDLFFDNSHQINVNKESFCATVNDEKYKQRTDIKYSCTETEQLYGVGYHKAYGHCKNDPFLQNFHVDYTICLHAHYPWIDKIKWGVCVMKTYKSEFLACYCRLDSGGNLKERSFCITKFECFLHGTGMKERNKVMVVQDKCMEAIEHFSEVNVKNTEWFKQAQHNDKLRVRPPYHPESPCKDEMFSALFDVGQLEEDIEREKFGNNLLIEVFTPLLDDSKVNQFKDLSIPVNIVHLRNRMDVPPIIPQCEVPDEVELKIEPELRRKKDLMKEIFAERILVVSFIWVPGLFYLYSYLFVETSKKLQFIINVVQFIVISMSFYNIIISMVLWKTQALYKGVVGRAEITILMFSLLITANGMNLKYIAEYLLSMSVVYTIQNLIFLYTASIVKTEGIMNVTMIIYYTWSVIQTLFVMWILPQLHDKNARVRKSSESNMDSKEISRRNRIPKPRAVEQKTKSKFEKGKKVTRPKIECSKKDEKGHKKHLVEKKKGGDKFLCFWDCTNVSIIGYVSLNCSKNCMIFYHSQCWQLFLDTKKVEIERGILGIECVTSGCSGAVIKIIWLDRCGNKTKRRLILDSGKCIQEKQVTKKHIESVLKKGSKNKKDHSYMENQKEQKDISLAKTKIQHSHKEESVSFEELLIFGDIEISEETKLDSARNSSNELEPIELASTFLEEYVPTSTKLNNFGTIGGERKLRKNCQHDSTTILDDILEDTALKPFSVTSEDSFGLSRILSMINESKPLDPSDEAPSSFQLQETEIAQTGFIIKMDAINSESSALNYSQNSINETEVKEDKFEQDIPDCTTSVSYISRASHSSIQTEFELTKSWITENIAEDAYIVLEDEETGQVGEEDLGDVDNHEETVSPITRIIRRALSDYETKEIELAVNQVLLHVDFQHITIPEFQEMVIQQLKNRTEISELESTYESDESDEEELEECLICHEILLEDLQFLDPCRHVFHKYCIQLWLQKDYSCPKCRAEVRT